MLALTLVQCTWFLFGIGCYIVAGGGYVGQAYMHWCMIFCVHEFRKTTAQTQLPGAHEVL